MQWPTFTWKFRSQLQRFDSGELRLTTQGREGDRRVTHYDVIVVGSGFGGSVAALG